MGALLLPSSLARRPFCVPPAAPAFKPDAPSPQCACTLPPRLPTSLPAALGCALSSTCALRPQPDTSRREASAGGGGRGLRAHVSSDTEPPWTLVTGTPTSHPSFQAQQDNKARQVAVGDTMPPTHWGSLQVLSLSGPRPHPCKMGGFQPGHAGLQP